MQTHFRTGPGRPQPGVEGPAKPVFILNDADLRAFEDGHDADMAKELAQADAMEAAGLSLPGRAGSGRGGKVTKADLEYDAEQAKIRDEKIALDLALNQATADRNAAQKLIQDLGGGSGRNVERIAVLQRELANGNPNADGYKIRAAELDKLQKFTAGQAEATAALGAAEAQITAAQSAIESIPKRRAIAAQRRDFNLEAEMKLERKDRRGKREDREKELASIFKEKGEIQKDLADFKYGEEGTPGYVSAMNRVAALDEREARLSARGGKRGKDEVAPGEGEAVDWDARGKDLIAKGKDPEKVAAFIAAKKAGAAPTPDAGASAAPASTPAEPVAKTALPPIPGWNGEYDSFTPSVPRKGGVRAPRVSLSLEPQPLDPPRDSFAVPGAPRRRGPLEAIVADGIVPPEEFDKLTPQQRASAGNAPTGSMNRRSSRAYLDWLRAKGNQ
jgi:hypothetical protein